MLKGSGTSASRHDEETGIQLVSTTPRGLKQQKRVVSQFWSLQVQNEDDSPAIMLPLKPGRESFLACSYVC